MSVKSRLKDETAVTLIELLVSLIVLMITLAATLTSLQFFNRQQPRVSEQADRAQQTRVALERITRAVRQGYEVNSSSSTSIDFNAYVSDEATAYRFIINCAGGTCTQQSGAVNGSLGTAQTVLTDVENTDIFTYEPDNVNPTFVQIKLTVSVNANDDDPTGPVTFSDGVQLRNASAG